MKLLLFDIDGTLLDVGRAEREAFSLTFEEVEGIRGVNTEWDSYLNYADARVVGEIYRGRKGREPSAGEVKRLFESFVRILEVKLRQFAEFNREIPGARAFLHYLKDSGLYAFALATGCIEKSASLKLASFHMDRFFSCGGFGEDAAASRSDILREALRAASAHYGREFAPEDAVYFGDRCQDAQAALSMGMGFIAVSQSQRERGEIRSLGAPHIFTDYTDRVRLRQALERVFSTG